MDLKKCGLYRYVEGDFHILLFAYAFDNEDVKIIDMACGEELPKDVLEALTDPDIIKSAWNAAFERTCIGHILGQTLPPDAWRCSMVWAASLSLPLALKDAATVLKTGEQKDRAGENLIKYFSMPCKPTAANGGRTRNLPLHDPEKWEKFKEYCLQDVRTERDIRYKLEHFPMPEFEWDNYHLDQRINDRGVKIDTDLVGQAIKCDQEISTRMEAEAKRITALDNPNSVSQLKGWLDGRGIVAATLDKKGVGKLIEELESSNAGASDVVELLKLRLMMAKSSVRKYEAARRFTCADGRAHGLFQFNGANRTGRFCLTGDHEVLTPEGWIRLDEWKGGMIACWNAQTEAVSFQKSVQLEFDYCGPMYTYCDPRINQCSTPDHKMRVQKRYGDAWTDMTVEEMAKCHPTIPMNGYRYHRGCANPAWLRVLIMTQADGFYTEDAQVVFSFKKQRKIDRCKSLLRKAEIPFVVRTHKDVTAITIPARGVPLWLREFRTKTFGFWLFDENPDIFFDELPNWDGYYVTQNSIQYSTCNKQNADIVQALAHLSGRCAIMKEKKNSQRNPNWNDVYVLDIWLTPKNAHEIRTKPTIEQFNGKVYCASTPTGYFLVRRDGKVWITGNSGRGIQLQNLPQNHIATLDEARSLLKAGEYEMLELLYGNTPDILSQLIRTMLVPKEGYEFIIADFSAIEARLLAWEADELWRLESFERGDDIYCASASQMFGVPVVKHGVNGHLRQKGKVAELACGYGGSVGALKSMGALEMGLTEDELPDLISTWREANPSIVQYWWDVDRAATETFKDGQDHYAGRLSFQNDSGTLWMVLPSGRRLAYCAPKLRPNQFGRMSLSYMGVDAANKWNRIATYGPKLVENATQAIARDILCEAMRRMESKGLRIVAHVHDEVIIEAPKDQYTVDEVCSIMNQRPAWGRDIPLSSAGYKGIDYYFKD